MGASFSKMEKEREKGAELFVQTEGGHFWIARERRDKEVDTI